MIGNKSLVRLMSVVTKKYLRIAKDGKVDALDGGSRWSTFSLLVRDANTYLFNIAEYDFKDHWLQCTEGGECNGLGKGGESSTFKMKMHGEYVALSPVCNLDWNLGVDQQGQVKRFSEVDEEKDRGAWFKLVVVPQ